MHGSVGDLKQRTLTIGGSIIVRLVSSFQVWTQLQHYIITNVCYFLVKSNLVKLETSRTVILLPTVSVLSLEPMSYPNFRIV